MVKAWTSGCVLVTYALVLGWAAQVEPLAHAERPSANPPGIGTVPVHRAIDPAEASLIVVCKQDSAARIAAISNDRLRALDQALLNRCAFSDLQAAVDHVQHRGTNIAVLPGTYLELPSLQTESDACKALPYVNLTHAQELQCPHHLNLVAIMGDPDSKAADGTGDYDCDGRLCDLEVEGMGQTPLDVVFDGRFAKLNVIRADRAFGIYFRNFTVQHSQFNGIYVMELDGFVIDRILARWNWEYGFLSFTADHGLYTTCEAYGSGDSGVYPGAQAQRFGMRPSTEVSGCRAHHNATGLSGTAGDSLYVHDNWFYDNVAGFSLDSLVPNHPGTPQNASVFVHNRVFSNNEDFFEYARNGTCAKPFDQIDFDGGVVCPSAQWEVGAGDQLAGGNFNVYAQNWIYDNWRWGLGQFWIPATVRGDNDPTHQLDTSNANRYYQNYMGFAPDGSVHPNGIDFWWDEEGTLNCWQSNLAAAGKQIISDPPYPTDAGGPVQGPAVGPGLPLCDQNPVGPLGAAQAKKDAQIAPCSQYDLHAQPDPPACPWLRQPPPPPGYVPTGYGPPVGGHAPPPQGWSLGPTPFDYVSPASSSFGGLPNTPAGGPLSQLPALILGVITGFWVGRMSHRVVTP